MNVSTTSPGCLVSVGYEKRNISDFVGLLVQANVDVLVDVRLNARSRKKGFSKTALANALEEAGIDYRHKRELGNPFREKKFARARFRRRLANEASGTYNEIVALAHTARVALMCLERDHQDCHRSWITDAAQKSHPHLRVVKI